VEKSNGSTGTLYWSMAPGIVAESDLAGNLQSEYVFFDGERVARKDFPGLAVSYYFSDHLKTASVITDSIGNIKSESDYYPWGGEIQFVANDSNHYKFTSKERDAETGLDYFGARYYSNGLGRFTSRDPKMISNQRMIDPQQWNMYSYTRNNPLTYVDPDGRELVLANDLSKSDKDRIIKDLSAAYRKESGRAAVEQLKKSDIKYVLGTGKLPDTPKGSILGRTDPKHFKGTIDKNSGKVTSVNRKSGEVEITFDFKKMDKNGVPQQIEQHAFDHEVAGHAIDFDTNPAAERNETTKQAEDKAEAAAFKVESQQDTMDKKEAEAKVKEAVHEPKKE
jgi:RHS repeat-associated protein